jgi:hypothetical protein
MRSPFISMKHLSDDPKEKSNSPRLFQSLIYLIALITGIGLAVLPHTALAQDDQITWEDFDEQASTLSESVSFLAAEITNGTCEEIHSLAPDLMFTINPGFKLNILEKLGQQITLHTPSYPSSSTSLRLEDALRIQYVSIPQGPLPRIIDNSAFITTYFAKKTSQQSEIIQAYHRLFLQERYKTGKPLRTKIGEHRLVLNSVLFSTLEYAIANFLCTKEELNAYLTASDEQRSEMLKKGKQDLEKLETRYQKQGQISPVEWLVSHFDMCNGLISLCKIAQAPLLFSGTEHMKQICNDRRDWVYEGFKGARTWPLGIVPWTLYVIGPISTKLSPAAI